VEAEFIDPNLVNSWGIAASATSFWWVANQVTGTSTLYDGEGVPQSLVVDVPPPPGSGGTGAPTGIVFNGGSDFIVSDGSSSGPARFIFAGEDGVISGWSPAVPPPPPSTQAQVAVDNSPLGSSYKGLALSANSSGRFLYGTDFANGRVDAFDATFVPTVLAGSFTDPNLPADFEPFGIHAIGDVLFVTYALRDDEGEDVACAGCGYVDVYDTDGNLLNRFASEGALNAPWGVTLAPADFGTFSNALLIGNFGDGRINAFDPDTGEFLGALADKRGDPLEIEGLWAIRFGNGGNAGPTNTLYFSAGPDDEQHGLFGRIDFVPPGHAAKALP